MTAEAEQTPRCETCKHWKSYPGPPDYLTGPTRRVCLLASEWGEDKQVEVAVDSYSDGDPWLITAPDFGCVLHDSDPEQDHP